MHGYTIELTNGQFYLVHGQRVAGANNAVPVSSLVEAWRVAERWKACGIRVPY